MTIQTDFVNEKTLLQHHTEELGVSILRSPKCRPEVASKGIKYDWVFSKNPYRQKPLRMKRGKESFRALVDDCTNEITVEHARLFTK